MALVGGFLASRFGPRKVVTAGMVVTATGMVLTGLSARLAVASAGRFLTGLGNGMVMAPSIVLMAAWFDTRRLGLASAIASSGTGLGLVVAGPVVPRIIAGAGDQGWRVAWYFFAAVALVMAVLTLALERDRPYETPRENSPRAPAKRTGEADLMTRPPLGVCLAPGAIYFFYGFAYLIYFTFFQKRLTADLGVEQHDRGQPLPYRRGGQPRVRRALGCRFRPHRARPDPGHHIRP